MYPIIADIQDKPVLVIGAGSVGKRKIGSLVNAGARVTVISEEIPDTIRALEETGTVKFEKRAYRKGDCRGYFLVIGATDSETTNREISAECRDLGTLVNIVDVPELCSFYVPAVVDRGALKIAITTSGRSPALARELRRELEGQFGPEYESFVDRIGIQRDELKAEHTGDPAERNRKIEESFREEFSKFRHTLNDPNRT